MKVRVLVLFLLSPVFVGCSSVNKLISGSEPADPVQQTVITPDTQDALGAPPDFGISTPTGYTKTVFHNILPLNGTVSITPASNSLVAVFIKDKSVNRWFQLGSQYSEAFWFSVNKGEGKVQIHGTHLEKKEYCVYLYLPGVQP